LVAGILAKKTRNPVFVVQGTIAFFAAQQASPSESALCREKMGLFPSGPGRKQAHVLGKPFLARGVVPPKNGPVADRL
jgi:hypothetical protein